MTSSVGAVTRPTIFLPIVQRGPAAAVIGFKTSDATRALPAVEDAVRMVDADAAAAALVVALADGHPRVARVSTARPEPHLTRRPQKRADRLGLFVDRAAKRGRSGSEQFDADRRPPADRL